jgi:hypothetical protein
VHKMSFIEDKLAMHLGQDLQVERFKYIVKLCIL